MNFQQLRIIRETLRRNLNLTEVGAALMTSQSGVSKHIKDLEDELGVELFIRRGKRLTDLTEPGRQILPYVERILNDAGSIRRVAEELSKQDKGEFVIATTHTQARYVLPAAIAAFRKSFPAVHLVIHQASPLDVARMLLEGRADLGIATEVLPAEPDLAAFVYHRWHHALIVPPDHRFAARDDLSLADLAGEPIITYQRGYTGRAAIDRVFEAAGLAPDIVLEAIDSDIIKAYVSLGMGVGIVSGLAVDPARDTGLAIRDGAAFFEENTSYLAVARGRFLRGFVFRFITQCRPDLGEAEVRRLAGI